MTISLVGSAGNTANATTVSVTLPAGISGGDAVLLFGVCSNTRTMTMVPSGWTVRSGWPKDGGSARHYIWTKDTVTSADSSTSVQVSNDQANKVVLAAAVYHSSVSFPANYIDAEGFTPHDTSGSSYSAPQVTSTASGDWGVAVFTVRGTDPTAWTPASGLTERYDSGTGNIGTGATSLHLTDSNGSIGAASTAWGSFSETNITASNGGGISLLIKENTAGGSSNPFPVIGMYRERSGLSWPAAQAQGESVYGVVQGHWAKYHAPGSLPLDAQELQAIADGKRLHVFWKPYPSTAPNNHWAYTAAGSWNATVDQVANAIKAVAPAEVWLTLHHEPEDDTTGATGNFSYSAYRGMWQTVRSRFDLAGVDNVVWVMVYQHSHSHPTEMINLWGNDGVMDSLVDIVSQQDYIVCSTTPASVLADHWLEDIDFLTTNADTGRNWHTKPKAVTEWGPDLGGNLNPCGVNGGNRGTDQHRADAIASIEAILQDLADADVVELRYYDARSDVINDPPTVDGLAFQSLKDASEAGQTGGGGGGGSPGPIQLQGFDIAGDGATQTTQTIAFELPAGWQQGDYALAVLTANSNPNVTAVPAGWDLVDGPVTNSSNNHRGWTYSRRLQAGDVNPTWTLSQSVRPCGVLGTWRGVDPDTPLHATSPLAATTSGTSQAAAAVTTTVAESFVVSVWLARWSGGGGSTNYGTVPASHTADASASTNPGVNAGTSALLGHVTANPVGAGSHGPYTATGYSPAVLGITGQYALLPAATTPPPPDPPPPPVVGAAGTPPQVQVLAALGSPTTTDPQAGFLVLNSGPPLDTGTLGGVAWVEIPGADLRGVTIRRGRAGELEASTPGGLELVLDGRSGDYDPTNTAGPFFGQLDVGFAVWVRATWDQTYDLGYAYVDDIQLDLGYDPTVTWSCVDGLEVLGRAKLAEIASSFDGDLSSTRIGRILDLAAWPSTLRQLDTGQSQVAATTYGAGALPLIQEVLDTEFGVCFIDGAGRLCFFDRYHQVTNPRSTTVQANFTDTAGATGSTEVEMASLRVSLARDAVFNHASVTRGGGTEQQAQNDTSIADYGIRTFPGSPGTLLRTDPEALNLAQWLVARFPLPKVRVTDVTVDATTQGLWQVLLPLTLMDRVRVTRDYGPNTVVQDLHIQGMTLAIDVVGGGQVDAIWTWTLQTSSPSLTAPILLDIGPPIGQGEVGF